MPAQPPSAARLSGRPGLRHVRAGVAELVLDVARTSVTRCDAEALMRQICAELAELCWLPGCAATILDGSTGVVRSVAGSSPEAEQLTRLVHQRGDAAAESTRPTSAVDLTRTRTALAEAAGRVGLAATASIPLRAEGGQVGCLQLFGAEVEGLSDELLREITPLADVLGVVLYDTEAYHHSASLVTELSAALDSQRPIEQAKGLLAERHRTDLDTAYRLLREQARRREITVASAAAEFVGQTWRPSGAPVPEQSGSDPAGSLAGPAGSLAEPGAAPLPEQRGVPTDRSEAEH